MKKILFIIGIGLAIIGCDQDDKKAGSDKQKAGSGEITDSSGLTTIYWVDSTFQNLGKVNKGGVVEVSFRFRNTGDKPLVISNARPGCGCTVTDPPKEPIAPGAEETIRAKFDSKNQHAGSHTKNITVTANTKPDQTHILSFTIEVVE